MKKNYNKIFSGIGLLILVLLVATTYVHAFGVSIFYSKDAPLILAPGETKDFKINLQTTDVEGNLTINASITNGSEIASLTDPTKVYQVNLGENADVGVRIKIPQNAVEGQIYTINFKFLDVTSSESTGSVSIKTSISPSMVVKVMTPPQVATPPEDQVSIWWIVLALVLVIAIILVIFFIFRSFKK